jgi:hypothetical protein
MPHSMIPGPGAEPEKAGQEQFHDSQDAGTGPDGRQQRRTAGTSDIPSENDCLRAIIQVGRLAALGLLKPGVANAVRNSFREVLQHYRGKAKETGKNIADADVLDLLEKDPRLLNLLEPLLSNEQVDMIMRRSGGAE